MAEGHHLLVRSRMKQSHLLSYIRFVEDLQGAVAGVENSSENPSLRCCMTASMRAGGAFCHLTNALVGKGGLCGAAENVVDSHKAELDVETAGEWLPRPLTL